MYSDKERSQPLMRQKVRTSAEDFEEILGFRRKKKRKSEKKRKRRKEREEKKEKKRKRRKEREEKKRRRKKEKKKIRVTCCCVAHKVGKPKSEALSVVTSCNARCMFLLP